MLRVWLPLNGDLHNQGVSNVNITTTATVNTNGKIGSCYSFSGNYITLSPSIIDKDNTEFSFTCWAKFNNVAQMCLFSNRITTNNAGITIFVFNDTGGKKILFDTGDRWTLTRSAALPTNEWVHLAFTWKKGIQKCLYINGILDGSASTSGNPTGATATTNLIGGSHNSTTTTANYMNGYLNDVRIYDHCLSAAEVREISQGLVLHYKLDSPYIETVTNLLTPSSDPSPTSSYPEPKQIPILLLTSTNTYMNYGVVNSNAGNNIVTYSAYIINTMDTTIYPRIRGMGADGSTYGAYVNGNTIAAGEEGWVSVTLNMTDTTKYNGTNVYLRWQLGKARNELHSNPIIQYAQLEVGDHRSPWVLGGTTRQGIAEDSSGYNHNGTILGNPVISSDTARYTSSTSFPANADGILSTYPLTLWNNAFTYSFWIKPSGENGGRSIYAASYSGTSCSIEKTTGNKLRFYWSGSPDLSTSFLTITDGTWQHIAIVKEENKTTVKCYYNGVLKDTFTNTFSDKTFSGNLRIARDTRGNATSYTGMMSDFRIYCTALDADAIRQLYEVGAKVDNKGNLHTFEINEFGANQLTKTGIMKDYMVESYKTLPDGSHWQLMMFHYVDEGRNMFTSTNASYCNDFGLYSRLRDIDKFKYTDTLYEFYAIQDDLEYRWTQTNAPTTSSSPGTVTTVSGYNNPSVGLARNGSNTYLGYNSWWGACGCWTVWQGNAIPGFGGRNCTKYLALYARISNSKFKLATQNAYASNFIEI